MSGGFFAVHRELMDKPIWLESSPEQRSILIALLSMVNFKKNTWVWEGKTFICMPGQVITSLPKITKKSGKGVTVQNVRTALKRFEKLEFLTDESTGQGRLVTILNWQVYQDVFNKTNSVANRQLTDNQQTANRQLTPNNNHNNDNNDKNDKKSQSVSQDGQTDLDSILENIQFELFETDLKETLKSAIVYLLQQGVGIEGLKLGHVDYALSRYRKRAEETEITTPIRYLAKCLESSIIEIGIRELE